MGMYSGKKILVVGLGLQGGGVGIAKYFADLGARVTVTDKKSEKQLSPSIEALKDYPITFHLGKHQVKDFLSSDVIFKGPSVLWSTPEIVAAEKKGIPVEMELSYFASRFQGKIIGVTGTRGKSTTTSLIFNLLKLSNFPVYLGGGFPGISTINYLKILNKNDWIVAEISSWALSGFHRKKISPHIAVLTNIYPDHLNYYNNMNDYIYDKKAIFLYQKKEDYFIVNENLKNFDSEPLQGKQARMTTFSKKDFPHELVYLKGDHNLENAAAALKVSEIVGIDRKRAVNIISNFQGLEYRQELIGEKNQVCFVNDTTSTTPVATIKAINSFKDKKIILILGGNSKNLPAEELITELKKVEKIVLLAGSFTDQILEKLHSLYKNRLSDKVYNNIDKAVKKAYEEAKKFKEESCVLFSPGATSFAMFNNEFHRGEEFNRVVKTLLL